MYHEKSYRDLRRRRRRRVTALVVACLVVVAVVIGFGTVQQSLREQGAAAVRDAVLDSAMQCCAIEGSYPSSLDYLEQEYGLRVNHDDYVITYEAFAGNVMPSVVVVPR
ncbi:MAG: hypothetical protein HFJ75_05400 [Eggerthellaceae bacterium]|nr:hypothetical protein [Eggerthellaceae bacterium]